MTTAASHKTRTLWLVGILHAFTHIYHVALLPLYLRIQHDLKLGSLEQATLLVTVLGLAYFLPSYPIGVLADHFSRKKLLAVGLAINGAGFVSLSLAPNYGWALASMVLAGFGGSFFHPAATALIARRFPQGRGRALGLVGVGASTGFFIGPIYCGWRAVVSGSWRAPILEIGLLGVIAAGLFAWLADDDRDSISSGTLFDVSRPHSRNRNRNLNLNRNRNPKQKIDYDDEAEDEKRLKNPRATAMASVSKKTVKLFPTPALWFFFLAASFAFSLRDFAGGAMATSASLFLQTAHGFNPKFAGMALSGIFLASAISNPVFGHLSDGGRLRWASLMLVMAALLIDLFPRVGMPWMIVVLPAYGFFFMASYPIIEAAVTEAVPDPVRGRVFGLFITVGGLISNLSHWLVGDWVQKLGARASTPQSYFPLYGVLTLLVLASLAGLPCLRAIRKREQRAELKPLVDGTQGIHSTTFP